MYNHASMNRVYRVVWNAALGVWQAVGEIGKGAGKGKSHNRRHRRTKVSLAGALFLVSSQLLAASLPENGVVTSGAGSISQPNANTLNITQATDKLAIDWQSFSIGQGNTVNFIQPSVSAIALNRVVGNDVSNIQGAINANGQVFLINPNGVLFSTTAQVNVGGLVASTRNITNDQFNAGNYRFEGDNSNAIINQGNIKTADGGYVVMIAATIDNTGNITANKGSVALGAGNLVTLDMGGPVKLRVEQGAVDALIQNGGAIRADGGHILLSAKSAGDLAASVINNTGRLVANSLEEVGGKIVLMGDEVNNSGTISANAAPEVINAPAGAIEITAERVTNSGVIEAKGNAHQAGGRIQISGVKIEQTQTALIDASATKQGGSVELVAREQVQISGTINVSAISDSALQTPSEPLVEAPNLAENISTGGQILVKANQIELMSATLEASGGQGGVITLDAAATQSVSVSTPSTPPAPLPEPQPSKLALNGLSQLNTRGRLGKGGNQTLIADDIHLNNSTTLSATGATGGGQVLVGGDWQGSGDIYQATTVTMEAGVTIDASATENGDGGKVVLWSDITNAESVTSVKGSITAKGGDNGGDGGRIETSGALLITEGVNGSAAAPKGKAGEWLFDPTNVTIGTSGTASPQNNGTSISATSITKLLNGGTSVTVTTSSNGSDLGDLTVNSQILATGSSEVTLTLRAANSIVINQLVGQSTTSAGKLNLIIDADNDTAASTAGTAPLRDGSGLIILEATLQTNGGDITFGGTPAGANGVYTGGDLYVGGGASAVRIHTKGGYVDVKGNLLIANSSGEGFNVNTEGGAIYLRKAVDSGNQYSLVSGTDRTWQQAFDNAKTQGGWLATIGSSLENALAIRAAGYTDAWLGGQRIIGTNEWRWTADPNYDANTNPMVFFYQGSTTPTTQGATASGAGGTTATGYFANWNKWTNGSTTSGEPNNWTGNAAGVFSQDNESALQFTGSRGVWNDLPRTGKNLNRYVLEKNLVPSRLQLNAGSGVVTIGGGVGLSKELSQLNVTSSNTTVNGGGIMTSGAQTYSGGVSVTHSGPIEVSGTTLTFNGNFNVTASGASGSTSDVFLNAAFTNTATSAASFNAQGPRHIRLGSRFSLASNSALNTTLWADTEKSADGIIYFEGSGINTNGGTLAFGKSGQTATVGASTVLVGGDVFFQRNTQQTLTTNGGELNVYGETIVSNTSGLVVNSQNGNATFHGLLNSGNQYTFVDKTASAGSGNWDQARTEAKNNTGGASAVNDSYLVNITSRLENSIAGLTSGYRGAWIGAYRPDSNSHDWVWADGPEGGQKFFTQVNSGGGSVEPGFYSNFNTVTPEPNGGKNISRDSTETAGQFFGSQGLWNDLRYNVVYSANQQNQYNVLGFVRETNLGASPVTVNAGSGLVTLNGGLGTAKAIGSLNVTANATQVNGNGIVTTGAQTYSGSLTLNNTTSTDSVVLKGSGITAGGNVAIYGGSINAETSISTATANADILIQGRTSVTSANGLATLNSGSGNVSLLTDNLVNNSAQKITVNSTGAFTFAPVSSAWSNYGGTLNFAGSLSGANFVGGASSDVAGLIINNVSGLGALTLGKDAITNNISIDSAVSINGSVNFYANDISLNKAVTTSDTLSLKSSGTITQSNLQADAITANSLLLAGGNVTLNNLYNNVNTLAASGVSGLAYINLDALTIGTVGITNGVSATGVVDIATMSGNLTLAKNVATSNTSATALTLNAGKGAGAGSVTGGNLIVTNNSTVTVGTGGTAKLFTGSILGSTGLADMTGLGVASGRFRYYSDETTTNFTNSGTTALTSGLNAIFRERPTAAVSLNDTTVTYGDALGSLGTVNTTVKLVDGNSDIVLTGSTALGDELYTIVGRTNSTSGNIKASSTAYTVSTDLAGLGYNVTGDSSGSLTVNAKALDISGLTASNKTYDALLAATLTGTETLTNGGTANSDGRFITSDTVSLTGAEVGTFDNKNVGTGKTVTVSGLSLTGADASNYSLNTYTLTADIAKADLSVSGATAANKVYDATNTASVTGGSVTALQSDVVSLSTANATFADKNVGAAKAITTAYTLTGTDAGNYNLIQPTGLTANITAKAITASGITARDKVYDAGVVATLDTSVAQIAGGATGDADNKYYTGDALTLVTSAATGAFANKTVGTGKAVTVSGLSLSGADSGNYTISDASGATAGITQLSLTVTGASAADKVYDATNTASVTGGSVSALSGDIVTLSAANATFADKNVGTAKAITTIYTITGTDANNYALVQPSGLTANITPKTVTLSASKTYDGTTDLSGWVQLGGFVGSETLTFSGATASDKHVATAGKYVNAITLQNGINGGLASNYQLPDLTAYASGVNSVTINAAQLTPTLTNTGVTKVYDGTTKAPVSATPTWSFNGLVEGDSAAALTYSGAAYNSKDVATADQITVTGLAIDGISGSNGSLASDYVLDGTSKSVSATITPAALTVTANNDAKFVTQTDTAGFAGVSYDGFVNGETASVLTGSASITRSNNTVNTAGVYSDVLVASGLTSTNYNITFEAGDYTIVGANQLLVEVTDVANTYGTATTYTVSSAKYLASDNSTIVDLTSNVSATGNVIQITDGSSGSASFTLAPVSGVNSTAGKLAVGNYQLGTSGTVTENSANFSDTITVVGAHQVNTKAITASASGVTKTYDGTTDMTSVTLGLSTLETSDVVTVNGMGAFAQKDVGTNLGYTVSNLTLSGADAGNYYLSGGSSLSGSNGAITARELTLSASKTYDGTDALEAGEVTFGNLVGTETLSFSGATVNNKHVATANKYINAITLSDGTNGGLASNYALPTLNAANAAVTINAATLTPTISNTGVTKVYSGNTAAPDSFTPTYTFAGLVSGDTAASLTHTGAVYNDKDVADANTITVSGLAISDITGSNSSQATDYVLDATSKDVSATITKANLTVTADNQSRVYGDANPIFTQTITGFVNSEDSTSAGITGTATGVTTATVTSNVGNAYVITGSIANLSAANYDFTAANGVLTITARPITVIADANQSKIYGEADPTLTYTVAADGTGTSRGLANSETLTGTLTRASGENVNSYAIAQGTLTNANNSNYAITYTANNFSITPRAISLTANSASKIYGELNPALTYQVEAANGTRGLVNSDTFTGSLATTATQFSDVGDYAITSTLANSNYAINYVGDDLTINQRLITLGVSGVNKVYDGNTTASLSFTDNRMNNDDVTFSYTALFDNKNVGKAKAVSVADIALTGTKGGNYTLNGITTANTTADINRLNSVTWIGGATGNWFDPANWAGGAVPDLSNVANVVIPTGVTVTFNNTATSPATAASTQANAVNIDSLGTLGSLNQTEGYLNVGNGGISLNVYTQNGGMLTNAGSTTLNAYTQNGGSFSGMGDFTTGSFTQMGGTTTLTNDLTATQDFSQTGNGAVSVGGNTHITDTNGGMSVGNLNTTGTTTLTSRDGAITQTNDTTLVSGGAANITAASQGTPVTYYDVTLNGANNDFQSTVNVIGNDVTLVDINDLDANITATGIATLNAGGALTAELDVDGNSTLTSVGNMTVSGNSQNLTTNTTGTSSTINFGTTTVRGDLSSTTNNGAIMQNGPINVTGTTGLVAGTGDITLNNADNDFLGAVTATGKDVTLRDTNDLNTTVNASGNAILDASGVLAAMLNVTSNSTLTSVGNMTVSGDSQNLTTNTTGTSSTTNFGTTTVRGNLSTTSTGDVNQTGPLDVTGTSTFNAEDKVVNLTDAANDFGGAVSGTAASMDLRDANVLTLGAVTTTGNLTLQSDGVLNLGTSTVGGNLGANSTNGNITQTGPLNVTGTTGVVAGTGDITLNNADNDFLGAVTAAGKDVTLKDTNGLNTTVNASGNGILDAGGVLTAVLNVTGNSSLTSVNNMTVSGNSLNLTTTTTGAGSTTTFGTTTVSGNLNTTTNNGNISQTGPLIVNGTSGLVAGTGDITLTNADNDFMGAVTAAGDDLRFKDSNSLSANLTATSDVEINAGTTLSTQLNVEGNSNLITGGDLNVSGNTTNMFVNSGGFTRFGDTNVYANLDVVSAGSVDQIGYLNVGNETNLKALGQQIILNNFNNGYVDKLSATAANMELTSLGTLYINDMQISGNLTLLSLEGDIIQVGNVQVGGLLKVSAPNGRVEGDVLSPLGLIAAVSYAQQIPITLAVTQPNLSLNNVVTTGSGLTNGAGVGNSQTAGIGGVSGGLTFVDLPEQQNNNEAEAVSQAKQTAGLDSSGFMRVVVVRGGINTGALTTDRDLAGE